MARHIVLACAIICSMAIAAMTVTVFTWMTVPERIVYRESSPARSGTNSEEVKEHGQSYFLTISQKQELDAVRNRTPWVMLAGFVTAFLAIVVGAAARLKMKTRQ